MLTVHDQVATYRPTGPTDDERAHLRALARWPDPGPTFAERCAAIDAAADPATVAALDRLLAARETASDQARRAVTRKGCSTRNRAARPCPHPVWLAVTTPHGPEVWATPCARRACPVCGAQWAQRHAIEADAVVPDDGLDLHAIELTDRRWATVRATIARNGHGAVHVPIPGGRRLVITDAALDGARAVDRCDALAELAAALAALPEHLRRGEIAARLRHDYTGEWRKIRSALRAQEPPQTMPEGFAVEGVLTGEGLDLDTVAADVEAAGGDLRPVTADPDATPADVRRWRPHGVPVERWAWLLRKWRLRTLDELAEAATARRWDASGPIRREREHRRRAAA